MEWFKIKRIFILFTAFHEFNYYNLDYMNTKNLATAFWILTVLSFTGCVSVQNSIPDSSASGIIRIENLKANLEFLADDLLEGREATTRGERIAGLFISSELKKYGVQPFYNDYYQRFDLISKSFDETSGVTYTKSSVQLSFSLNRDFYVIRSSASEINSPVVFAGYGITAEEFNYDDFSDIDVKDKIIAVLPGEPVSDDVNYFNGSSDTRYASLRSKILNATALGVKGILFLDTDSSGYNWQRGYDWFTKPDLSLKPAEEIFSIPVLYFNQESSALLLQNEKHSLESLLATEKTGKIIPKFDFQGSLSLTIRLKNELKKSFNIIGVIPGTDEKLKDEYVAIGAHFDHLGVSGDSIYNGADDDGSGIVAVLEVANAISKMQTNKRSVLVVFHAAEEKGLFGSEYLSDNLEIMDKIVAQVNLDMVGRESVDTIYSVGSDKINPLLKQIVERANTETSNFVFNFKFDEPDDPEKIYYRSDHYNYAKLGIPVVFFYDNMKEDYHRPSDEVNEIDFQKIKKTAELVLSVVLKAANYDVNLRTNK
ncbi:MAG: M28 family peptidase [Ignavibacteriales bacterium]|nr:MAG: M28 family peptidase [Ignavibacteriales bacterium]